MIKQYTVLSVVLIVLLSTSLFAQTKSLKDILLEALDNNKEVFIALKNADTYTGWVVSIKQETVGVQTKNGLFNFNLDRIKDVRLVNANDPASLGTIIQHQINYFFHKLVKC